MAEQGRAIQVESPKRFSPVDISAMAMPMAMEELAALHAEAEENARLLHLLSGSFRFSLALTAVAFLFAVLSSGAHSFAVSLWLGLVAASALAGVHFYQHTEKMRFSRMRLRAFARKLGSVLMVCGFAWGTGAYLLLAPGSGLLPVVAFVAVPSMMVIFLLREYEAVFLFLLPLVPLTAFACILRPFANGTLGAGVILLTGTAVYLLAKLQNARRIGKCVEPAMPMYK